MITLITGVPGSGKTLYAISELLRPLVGATIPIDSDGVTTIHPRTLYTNINGLLIEHELIVGTGEWKKSCDGFTFNGDNDQGLHNWHEWAKPGAIICYDEFQKAWPPRPNGAPVPPDLQALDTHRHMGVDFILVTQNCMNVDRHIIGLVGRHLHIRRVANMALSVVYEWDHASKSLLFKNSITKSPWRFDKKVYKLYKSAEVHTKQKRKMPGLVWFVLLGLAGAAYLIPTFTARLQERVTGTPPAKTAPASGKPVSSNANTIALLNNQSAPNMQSSGANGMQHVANGNQVSEIKLPVDIENFTPALSGCVKTPKKCTCYDTAGAVMPDDLQACKTHIAGSGALPAKLPAFIPELHHELKRTAQAEQDGAVLAAMARTPRSLSNN